MTDANDRAKNRKRELDDFWSFDELVPKKKESAQDNQVAGYKRAEPVEVSSKKQNDEPSDSGKKVYADQPLSLSGVGMRDSGTAKRHYISDAPMAERKAPEPEAEYQPEASLIHKARIYKWESSYNYYEQFRVFAERFFAVEGKPSARVPFFSYVPQYNQLNREQLEFYFWWRSCVRRGEYIDADYSYILLYVYETINLSGEKDYMALRDILFGIWLAYRERYVRLDALLGEWIFDFCIIHRLPPPKGKIPLGAIGRNCGTAEFFVSAAGSDSDKYVAALLAYCTSYDYRKSKFYEGDNTAIYDRYVPSVLRVCLEHLSKDGKFLGALGYTDSKASREAYTGALCSCRTKKRIEIEFCSFSRSHELRYLVGDIVKYSENIIRSYIGIKSRLTVFSVPAELEEIIRAHLKSELPQKKRAVVKKEESHEFDKFYEPIHKSFSIIDAQKIEDESWNTTRILVEAFAEDVKEEVSEAPTAEETEEKTEKEEKTEAARENNSAENTGNDCELRVALGELLEYVCALLMGDNEKKRAELSRLGRAEEVVVDRVNEIAADVMGDIIVEEGESGAFEVIEDYFDTLEDELLH